ncbi:MAG: M48 family metallopeptidase [Bacteroidales bacterium]|nr:M48 family metallopeptidase [Bacteroidales bacterium]
MKKKSLIIISSLLSCSIATYGQYAASLKLKEDKLNVKAKKMPANIKFSYDCLLTDAMAQAAFTTNNMEVVAVKMAPGEITAEEENKFGQQVYDEVIKTKKEITTGPVYDALKKMTNDLLACRPDNHSKLVYTVHLMDDTVVNAYTAGGQIFVNTGLIKYCKTTSELACIIAHEIGHDEKGHINLILKRIKVAGRFGEVLLTIKQITTPSFNQFNEHEVDCYGADLAYAAGYDPRAGAKLWQRMAKDRNEQESKLAKFLMSHPYSKERYECMKTHIKDNYISLKFD